MVNEFILIATWRPRVVSRHLRCTEGNYKSVMESISVDIYEDIKINAVEVASIRPVARKQGLYWLALRGYYWNWATLDTTSNPSLTHKNIEKTEFYISGIQYGQFKIFFSETQLPFLTKDKVPLVKLPFQIWSYPSPYKGSYICHPLIIRNTLFYIDTTQTLVSCDLKLVVGWTQNKKNEGSTCPQIFFNKKGNKAVSFCVEERSKRKVYYLTTTGDVYNRSGRRVSAQEPLESKHFTQRCLAVSDNTIVVVGYYNKQFNFIEIRTVNGKRSDILTNITYSEIYMNNYVKLFTHRSVDFIVVTRAISYMDIYSFFRGKLQVVKEEIKASKYNNVSFWDFCISTRSAHRVDIILGGHQSLTYVSVKF